MSLYIKTNGNWDNILPSISPAGITSVSMDYSTFPDNLVDNRFYVDPSLSESEQASRKYVNNTGKVMYVYASLVIFSNSKNWTQEDYGNLPIFDSLYSNDYSSRGITNANIAGSYCIAYVDGREVSRYRDNGATNEEGVFNFEVEFFVPDGSTYWLEMYKYPDSETTPWTGGDQYGPFVETLIWRETTFGTPQ